SSAPSDSSPTASRRRQAPIAYLVPLGKRLGVFEQATFDGDGQPFSTSADHGLAHLCLAVNSSVASVQRLARQAGAGVFVVEFLGGFRQLGGGHLGKFLFRLHG